MMSGSCRSYNEAKLSDEIDQCEEEIKQLENFYEKVLSEYIDLEIKNILNADEDHDDTRERMAWMLIKPQQDKENMTEIFSQSLKTLSLLKPPVNFDAQSEKAQKRAHVFPESDEEADAYLSQLRKKAR